MSALWPRSGDQLMDNRGRPRIGAVAEFFLASTTTPIVVYLDEGLTTPATDDIVTDGNGIWPVIFIDDELLFYRYRTKTGPAGAVLSDLIKVPAYGPAWWTAAAPPVVDTTAYLTTGDIFFRPGSTARPGSVRCNGRNIGNASSGATERANADTQALFIYLWGEAASYPVSGGRGATAAADFAANKTIGLPDGRGRVPVGIDTMGNTASGRMPTATGANIGGGVTSVTLTIAQMPSHDHGGIVDGSGGHEHFYDKAGSTSVNAAGTPINGGGFASTSTTGGGAHSHGIFSQGGGAAHANDQPWISTGWFIKL